MGVKIGGVSLQTHADPIARSSAIEDIVDRLASRELNSDLHLDTVFTDDIVLDGIEDDGLNDQVLECEDEFVDNLNSL